MERHGTRVEEKMRTIIFFKEKEVRDYKRADFNREDKGMAGKKKKRRI